MRYILLLRSEKKKNFNLITLIIGGVLLIIFLTFNHAFSSSQKCEINKLRIVSYGQKNIYVKNLQYCLKELGYFINNKELGTYGPSTIKSVKKFYKDNANEIFQLSQKTNTLWQIKNWSGKKIGKAGIQVLKNKIKDLRKSKTTYNQGILIALILELNKKLSKEKGQITSQNFLKQSTQPPSGSSSGVSQVVGGSVVGGSSGSSGGGTVTAEGTTGESGGSTGGAPIVYPKLGISIKNTSDISIPYIKRINTDVFKIIGQFNNNGIILGDYNLQNENKNFVFYNTNDLKFSINDILEDKGTFYILAETEDSTTTPILIKVSNNQIDWAFNYKWFDNNIYCTKLSIEKNILQAYCMLENHPPGLSSILILFFDLNGSLIGNYFYSNSSSYFGLKGISKIPNPNFSLPVLLISSFGVSELQENICLWILNDEYKINKSVGLNLNSKADGVKILYSNNYIYLIGNVLENNYFDPFIVKFDSNLNKVSSKIYRANNIKNPLYALINQSYIQLLGNFQNDLSSKKSLFYLSLSLNGDITSSKVYKNQNYNIYATNLLNDVNNNLLISGSTESSQGKLYALIFNTDPSGNVNFTTSSNLLSENLQLSQSDLLNIQNVECDPNQIGSLGINYFEKNPLQFSSSSIDLIIEKIIE